MKKSVWLVFFLLAVIGILFINGCGQKSNRVQIKISDKDLISLIKGDEFSVNLKQVPENEQLLYKSSNESIFSVNNNRITAKEIGVANLTVSSEKDNSNSDTILVRVIKDCHNDSTCIYTEPSKIYYVSNSTRIVLKSILRDFKDDHPDFERAAIFTRTGLIQDYLRDDKPVLKDGQGSIESAASFDQWYRDVPGVNIRTSTYFPLDLYETVGPLKVYTYENNNFFPIDNQLFGNQGRNHNFHFTLETHNNFTYQRGQVFHFVGDDDVWVFINKKLVVDLGGIHGAISGEVNLDDLGLTPGKIYPFDLFYAERHTVASDLKMETSIVLNSEQKWTYDIGMSYDNNGFVYSLENAPTGMIVDSNGEISYTPELPGNYSAKLKIVDDKNRESTQLFTIEVR